MFDSPSRVEIGQITQRIIIKKYQVAVVYNKHIYTQSKEIQIHATWSVASYQLNHINP